MTSIAIILGSVRPGRWGEQVTNWIQARAQEAGLDASVVDLKEFDLPIFAEEPPSMVVPTQPEGVRLRETLESRDGFIFVTPVDPQGQADWHRRLLVARRRRRPRAPAPDPVRDGRRTCAGGRCHQPWLRVPRRNVHAVRAGRRSASRAPRRPRLTDSAGALGNDRR